MSLQITFTAAAKEYIKKALSKQANAKFRLSVKKTGCSGYSYLPTVVEEIKSGDVMVDAGDGLTIYVDATWLHLLEGVQVDYVEDNKSGIKQKRLEFSNPQESGRCGCGESFHLE
jgi:iron-sulfur cluster assembly accessory protein